MCNLLRYKAEIQEVHGVFQELSEVRITPKIRFKVAPSETAPVIRLHGGQARLGMMAFGWKTARGRQLMARGETVATLPMFRDGFRFRRCLVIAHGFYDSLDMGHYRQPWHIHLKSDGVMGLAGLWEERPDGGAFTLVSTRPNAVVARVIDRMPVILPPGAWKPWLDPMTAPESLQSLLVPSPAEEMEAWPVTRQVNQRGFDSPECIVPVVPEQGELNL